MKLHRNAKSTPSSRLLLVRRVLFENWSYLEAAEGAGMSKRTVAKWVRRFREAGIAGLEDASSRPGAPAHQTPPWAVTLIQWLREQHACPRGRLATRCRSPARPSRPGCGDWGSIARRLRRSRFTATNGRGRAT
jgi:transposase